MVKIRLRRMGYKKNPIYRIVVINSSNRREGTPIQELGFYNPKTKEMKMDKESALSWISKGAQTSETVAYLIKNCDDEGKLIYKAKKTTKSTHTKTICILQRGKTFSVTAFAKN